MIGLAPLLLVFPIIGVLFNGFFGRGIVERDRHGGETLTGWFAATMSLLTFVVSIMLVLALRLDHHAHIVHLFDWINIPSANFRVPWALQIDTLSVTMLMVITGVGSLIHIYAIGYMHGDENFSRFFTYLNLFLFFMILLVTGSSYLVLFVGWEGVGLCSFLLIGYWFAKDRVVEDKDRGEMMYEGHVNGNAARKAMIANRVGDFCMILAMGLIFWTFGSFEYIPVFEHALEAFETTQTVTLMGTNITVGLGGLTAAITALLLLGATGKSAQIPLMVWLPDAMAGPTPVSALMHAATMVTSGIYLIVRSNVLFEITRALDYKILGLINTPDLVALIGAITAVYAGLIAFTQFDIKKVLAYSTVSQLGFMIAAIGMGAYVAGMFHLVTHAFFKALLFMGAGSVIHGMEHGHHHIHDHHGHDEHAHHPGEDQHGHEPEEDPFDPQDMRYMGNLIKHMPTTAWTYIVGALALSGIVPLAGFWSKDEILAHSATNDGWIFTTVNILLTVAAFCTAFYMGRQLKMTFFGSERHEATHHAHESPPTMTGPLVILAVMSIIGGLLNFPYLTEQKGYGDAEHLSIATELASTTEIVTVAEEGSSKGFNLIIEHWLEHSIESFELDKEHPTSPTGAKFDMPNTPTNIQWPVAIQSSIIAIAALAISFFVVYSKYPEKATDEDPIIKFPPFSIMKLLPLNTLYTKGFMALFNEIADTLGRVLDWELFHDAFHEDVLRRGFINFSNFLSGTVDKKVVDGGMVLGLGRAIRGISTVFKGLQTGYVRNYALGLFLGVVALVAYFIFL